MKLVDELFDGPLDIVGDVHGEYETLIRLLKLLGYSADGSHPERRRLVFLGDLVDRGHDSPAVLELVMAFTEAGHAQCVLGNHELNILTGTYGHGNGWLLQPEPWAVPEDYQSVEAQPHRRDAYLDFMDSQPLALENAELRVVHACWHQESIAELGKVAGESGDAGAEVARLLEGFDDRTEAIIFDDVPLQAALDNEKFFFDAHASESDWQPQPVPGHTIREFDLQMKNPIRVLTTSTVRPTAIPYYGAGRWRMTERIPWWNTYRDNKPVVIGHFWRQFSSTSERRFGVFGQDVLAGVRAHDWMGLRRNVYCVDYSVGQLHLERRMGDDDHEGKLAALRYPDWSVMHDDGTEIAVGRPDS
ncbi:MAG: metallophosphoesterase [Acidimicrobiales bacterium]